MQKITTTSIQKKRNKIVLLGLLLQETPIKWQSFSIRQAVVSALCHLDWKILLLVKELMLGVENQESHKKQCNAALTKIVEQDKHLLLICKNSRSLDLIKNHI